MTLTEEQVKARIKAAKVNLYEHGGARIYFEHEDGRELIADLYGDGEYRDYILKLLGKEDSGP